METLKKQRDFDRVYGQGESCVSRYLVLYWYSNPREEKNNRFGFSISKKVGKAVVRNKLRRRLKEIIRLNHSRIKPGFDCIFIVRNPAVNLNFHELKKEAIKLYKKAGLWLEE
ncbi:MAG: ribonuclease P protein component [Halanaerobiales bacterium]